MSKELEERFLTAMASINTAETKAARLAEQFRIESERGSPTAGKTFAALMDAEDEVECLCTQQGFRVQRAATNAGTNQTLLADPQLWLRLI